MLVIPVRRFSIVACVTLPVPTPASSHHVVVLPHLRVAGRAEAGVHGAGVVGARLQADHPAGCNLADSGHRQ